MDMHPTLWKVVVALLIFVAVGVVTYWYFYTHNLKTKQAALNSKGRMPVSTEEGIAVATVENEKAGRTGTIT
jgi:hypothetical protein